MILEEPIIGHMDILFQSGSESSCLYVSSVGERVHLKLKGSLEISTCLKLTEVFK